MINWKKRIREERTPSEIQNGVPPSIDMQGLPQYTLKWDKTSKVKRIYEYDVILPSAPSDESCVGYGLPIEDQIFYRTYIPPQVRYPDRDFGKDNWTQKQIDDFIDDEWNRRINGVWFWIKGEKFYITGIHWLKMNHWTAITGKRFIYKFAEWEFFNFWMHCVYDPKCKGMIDFKCRQIGDTEAVCIIMWEFGSRVRGTLNTMQSCINEDHVIATYERLVHGHINMIYYFKPMNQGTENPKKGLVLDYPTKYLTRADIQENHRKGEIVNKSSKDDYEYPPINSRFKYGPSKVTRFDGATGVGRAYLDEFGKCFSPKTRVLMYDGSYKPIKSVRVGDLLMGDDSTPRTVNKVHVGETEMYRINPVAAGWEPYECTGNHVLVLKWGKTQDYCKWKRDEVVTMTVNEYLTMSANIKRHLCLFRHQVEYVKTPLRLDPYILGAWLGDGTAQAPAITSIDDELIDYFKKFAILHNLAFVQKDEKSHYLSTGTARRNNFFINQLRYYKVWGNKHIPLDYLLNDRENRLQLLAGLIDTDGYLMHNKKSYEIVQKNKKLSFQIKKLCVELGFKATIASKIATMNRADGSIYRCKVYRLSIFGDKTHEIPCKIKRKQVSLSEIRHLNTRDASKTCLTITTIGKGEFVGLNLDGNNKFLLRDCQVVHNCTDMNPTEWLKTLVEATYSNIFNIKVGLILMTSTVEDIGSDSLKYSIQLWNQSDPNKRSSDGMTTSGLYRIFRNVVDRGEVDRWGFPLKEKIIAGINETYKRYIESGDIKGAISFKRKNCITIEDVFQSANDNSQFDIENLSRRMFYVQNEAPKSLYVRGNFKWKDGIKDSVVIWEPNPKGRWIVSKHPVDFGLKSNAKVIGVTAPKPANTDRFCCGVDPFDQKTTLEADRSLGAIAVYAKLDPSVDGGPEMYYQYNNEEKKIYIGDPVDGGADFKTNRFVCTYLYRHDDPVDFYEDCILTWVYYGTDALVEKQKSGGLFTYLMMRNHELYKMDLSNPVRNYRGQQERDGITASDKTIEEYFSLLTTLTCKWCNTIDHPDLLEQLLSTNYANRGKKDLSVAAGFALKGATIPQSRRVSMEQSAILHFTENFV